MRLEKILVLFFLLVHEFNGQRLFGLAVAFSDWMLTFIALDLIPIYSLFDEHFARHISANFSFLSASSAKSSANQG